jgi:hypothetical protein
MMWIQVDMALMALLSASNNSFAAELPIKRLLLLLEMARQSTAGADEPHTSVIPIERWTQVIQDLAS